MNNELTQLVSHDRARSISIREKYCKFLITMLYEFYFMDYMCNGQQIAYFIVKLACELQFKDLFINHRLLLWTIRLLAKDLTLKANNLSYILKIILLIFFKFKYIHKKIIVAELENWTRVLPTDCRI